MANDRADFAPEIRNGAWWSGDTRLAASGRAGEAILQKLGLTERPDLSGVEAVQMGHVMQPVIGRLVTDRLGLELRDADYALQHPTESWLKSHFDFITTDGKTLVEAKNYGIHNRNKFDTESNIVPAADYAQCLHEATVHGVENVILAVLFGGQEFVTFQFSFGELQQQDFIQEMAEYWSSVVAKNPLPPETSDQARALFPSDTGGKIMANQNTEQVATQLRNVRARLKELEVHEDQLLTALQSAMGSNSELITVDGTILATWKCAKASKRFDSSLFKSSMPDLYEKFIVEAAGSRRFLLK